MKKITFIIVVSLILIASICNYSYVFGFNENTSVVNTAKEWIELGKEKVENNPMEYTGYWSVLAGVLTGIGIWVIVISGAILGIRFMIVSPDKKAEVKKSLMIWLVGTFVILGALTIWRTLIVLLDIY